MRAPIPLSYPHWPTGFDAAHGRSLVNWIRRNMIGAVFLNHYRAVTLLGQGATGSVFLARHTSKDEVVVIKLINKTHAKQPEFREFFDREIETLAALKHPNIVGLRGFDLNHPLGPCLAMEFIPGVTLERLIERHRQLPVERVYGLLLPLCRALAYGHARQVTHRDLKPANLMVLDPDTPNESLKVMDFGLAQLAVKPHIPIERLQGEKFGTLCGTPLYVAPEGLRGDTIDHRADIYSVGVMLFELLTGTEPFNHKEVDTVLHAHLKESPPPFVKVRPDLRLAPAIEAVVRRCLEKFPYERPQTARQLAEEFARASALPFDESIFPHEEAQAPAPAKAVVNPPPPELASGGANTVANRFDAWMPEPIAVMKLRGFVDDHHGEILVSEPGKIRVRFGDATQAANAEPKGLRGWFASKAPAAKPTSDPIEMVLYMARRDQTNRLELTVVLKPFDGHRLTRPADWHPRCKALLNEIRAYFMAK